MSLAKAGRKLKRTGKTAVQFRFTSTFEYMDLECIGPWRPENVKVVWQRAHRKAESNNIQWVPVADRGPDGATGRALFEPTISVALIVTLYRDPKTTSFEEKVYKYYIEHEGAAGKKVLASFHCDVAEYAGVPSTKSALELDCKPVSKKIRKAHIGVTLESEYIKEGVANDEDMQSTYSHMTSVGVASTMDDQDSDEEDGSPPLSVVNTYPIIEEQGSLKQEEAKISNDKTMATIAECSGTFEVEPRAEEQGDSQLQEEGDSPLKKEMALQNEKEGDSGSQPTESKVASKPEESQLWNEGHSQVQEEGDSQLVTSLDAEKDKPHDQLDKKHEEAACAKVMGAQAVGGEQESWLLVNGGLDVVSGQEAHPGSMADTEGNKGSMPETALVDDIVVKKVGGDSASLVREGTEAEGVESDRPGSKQSSFKAEKLGEPEVTSPQEVKPQEEPKLQEGDWVVAPPETNKEASLPPASWVLVTGGEWQDSPTSLGDRADNHVPNQGPSEGQKSAKSAEVEAVQEPDRTAEGLKKGESQTGEVIEGKPGMVEIDITTADPDPEVVTSKNPQQSPAEVKSKGVEAADTSTSNAYLPRPGRSLKNKQPGAETDTAAPEKMSTAASDKVENPTPTLTPTPPPSASQPWLPTTVKLVNQNGKNVPITELDDKQIIGLYFTAQWCPPCRKFMPKLIKFFKILKENNCRFHLIYVSSDHTEDDMFEYMQMQKVPFPAISFTSSIGDELRQKYGVHQVPHLVIINRDCKLVDDQARKSVEVAVTNTSAMQCYQNWLEGVAPKQPRRTVSGNKKEPSAVASGTSPPAATAVVAAGTPEKKEREVVHSHLNNVARKTVQSQPQAKNVTGEELEEKIERIRELEETKEALQQTVTDVTEENVKLKSRVAELEDTDVAEENVKLKSRVAELEDRLKEVHTVQTTLLREKKDLADQMNLRGWLMKRGVSGPTGRKWRRRFFRTDQGNQLCYYKGTTGEPQGWIDLLKVRDVRKVSSEAQDKTNLTFEVVTDGRVYELLAENASDMDKWMMAIKNLAEFSQRNAERGQATPPPSS